MPQCLGAEPSVAPDDELTLERHAVGVAGFADAPADGPGHSVFSGGPREGGRHRRPAGAESSASCAPSASAWTVIRSAPASMPLAQQDARTRSAGGTERVASSVTPPRPPGKANFPTIGCTGRRFRQSRQRCPGRRLMLTACTSMVRSAFPDLVGERVDPDERRGETSEAGRGCGDLLVQVPSHRGTPGTSTVAGRRGTRRADRPGRWRRERQAVATTDKHRLGPASALLEPVREVSPGCPTRAAVAVAAVDPLVDDLPYPCVPRHLPARRPDRHPLPGVSTGAAHLFLSCRIPGREQRRAARQFGFKAGHRGVRRDQRCVARLCDCVVRISSGDPVVVMTR